MSARRAGVLFLAASLSVGCHSRQAPSVELTPVASPIRGTEEAADSVAERDRLAVYRELLRDFYRPVSGQARWIDPHALGEKRGSPDEASRGISDEEMPPDATWAEGIVEASGLRRVCVLGGAEDDCRGRPGGVLRFSAVYAAGPGRVRVFARYTPHAGQTGPPSEMRFTLERRGDEWRIIGKTSIPVS